MWEIVIEKLNPLQTDKLLSPVKGKHCQYSISALLASLAQIRELIPLIEEELPLWEFINEYMEKAALHPLFCAIIVALLIYTDICILGEKKRFWFWAHVVLFFLLLNPVIKNITTVVSLLVQMVGLWRDGYNWFMLIVVALFASCYFLLGLKYLKKKIESLFNRFRTN